MIRVLQSVSNMDRGGIETMLMNYYRHIDREKIQFDFIANKTKPGDYDEEIRSMGGRVFLGPGLSPAKYPQYMQFMSTLLKDNPSIRILHAHNEAMAYYALNGAKKVGLPVRIAHAHNTKIIRDYKWPLKMVCKSLLPHAATDYWSCGTDAGVYYYGKKRWEQSGRIMNNAIDLSRFGFSLETRERLRKENDLTDKVVIGHVGRFNLQKNHTRLLDIFAAISAKRENARLVLVGVGELEQEIRQKAEGLGITDKILFLGLRSDVNDWYMAMDVFVMPSLFEGLPVVGIEAQASGLACVYSDKVTKEAVVLEESTHIALSCSDQEWADTVLDRLSDPGMRKSGVEAVRKAGYDIFEETAKLQKIYEEMSQRK